MQGAAQRCLAPATVRRYRRTMADQSPRPDKPFALTPSRILILVFGALALVYIVGALLGGVGNYQQLREAAQKGSASSSAPSSSAN